MLMLQSVQLAKGLLLLVQLRRRTLLFHTEYEWRRLYLDILRIQDHSTHARTMTLDWSTWSGACTSTTHMRRCSTMREIIRAVERRSP
jgi:hypothetical protein